jgi:hypothetical protein
LTIAREPSQYPQDANGQKCMSRTNQIAIGLEQALPNLKRKESGHCRMTQRTRSRQLLLKSSALVPDP